MKSFALRQLLRCRCCGTCGSADSVGNQRCQVRRVTGVQGKESKDGRVQRADGGSCSRARLRLELSAAAKRCRRWVCDPDAAAECLNAAWCAARIREALRAWPSVGRHGVCSIPPLLSAASARAHANSQPHSSPVAPGVLPGAFFRCLQTMLVWTVATHTTQAL